MKNITLLVVAMLICTSTPGGASDVDELPYLPLPAVPREVASELGIEDTQAIPQYFGGWYYFPSTLRPVHELNNAVFFSGPLDLATVLMIDIVTSAQNGCLYCLCAGFIGAEGLGVATQKLVAIQGELPSEHLSDKENALMQLAAGLTVKPQDARHYVEQALANAWTQEEVAHAIHVTALMNMNNLMAEGFGYPPDWMHPYSPGAKLPIDQCGTPEERRDLLDFFGIVPDN